VQVAISEFEARCIEFIEIAHETGEEIIVTMSGKPFVRVVGIVDTQRPRILGGQPGVVVMSDNPKVPAPLDFED
jgi:prevent-host-death family protein